MRLVEDEPTGGEKQGMGGGQHTRRSRSSLDFKVQQTTPLTTTKPGKRKNRQQQQLEEEEHQLMVMRNQPKFRYHQSRARGNAGPPPTRYELSDLEHLSREQVMHALYSDPELAQEAARMAEKMSEKEGPPSAAPTKSRRSSSSGKKRVAKEFSEYPDHLRERMDGGVPVLQWVILLVLLGAALFQLRKILTLPDTKDPAKGRARGKVGPKKSTKKVKGSSTEISSGLATVEEAVRAIGEADVAPSAKKSVKKATPVPPKKKKRVKANNGAVAPKKQQPEATSADESPSEKDSGKSATDTTVPLVAPMQTSTTREGNDTDAGWQTVSKARAPSEAAQPAAAPTTSKKKSSTAKPPVSAEEAKAIPSEKDKSPVEKESAALNGKKENTPPTSTNGSSAANKKKNKKKKSKEGGNATPSVPPGFGVLSNEPVKSETANDEALAKKLQLEEETMTHTTGGEAPDDVWEEVTTTRKRKGN